MEKNKRNIVPIVLSIVFGSLLFIETIVLIIIIILGYNYRIAGTKYVTLPYAKTEITSKTRITSDMIGKISVPSGMIKGKVYKTTADIIGKYVNANSTIPKGSFFYIDSVVMKGELPDSFLLDYPEDYVLVNMDVNTESTYGNKIYPGNYIDIYLKIAKENTNEMMVGKLIENVKVLATLDANGEDVFEDAENPKTPAQIIFAVPEEYHILLRKTMYLKNCSATLIPVPINQVTDLNAMETRISNETLKDYINKITLWTGEGIDETSK